MEMLRLEFKDEDMVSKILNSTYGVTLTGHYGAVASGNLHCCFKFEGRSRADFRTRLLDVIEATFTELFGANQYRVGPVQSPWEFIVDGSGQIVVWEVDSRDCSK